MRFTPLFLLAATVAFAAPAPKAPLYLGGEFDVSLSKTAIDASGNVYSIGARIVTIGAYTARTVFVTKTDPSGATVYTTRLGGKGDDVALAIGIDASGRVFGAGYTTSPDFPLLHPIQTETAAAGTTGFVFALDASGDLLWSTYFGGSGLSHGSSGSSVKALAVDAAGNTYITGTSDLPNLRTTPGAFQPTGNFGTVTYRISNAFVAKLSPAGQLVWSTWLGGKLIDCNYQGCFYMGFRLDAGTAIAVDKTGNAYVAGYTDSLDFPTTPGAFLTQTPGGCASTFCPAFNEYFNAFLTKLNPDGTGLVYSTFLGTLGPGSVPPGDGFNKSLALDAAGDVYVAFATTGANVANNHIRILGLNPAGTDLRLSRTLGGSGDDRVTALALDTAGDIYLAGVTTSQDFPDTWGLYPAGSDFLSELSPDASRILVSARLPGGLASQDLALLSPAGGAVLAAGASGHIMRLDPFTAASLPTFLGAGNSATGTIDGALTPNEVVTLYGAGIGPVTPVVGQPLTHSNSVIPASYPVILGGVQVSFNGQPAALLYVSSNQINLGMPYRLSSPVSMTITNNGVVLGPFAIAAAGTAPQPGIFRNADGSAAALNQDGTLNSPANPALRGSIVAFWGTGIPALINGAGGNTGGDVPPEADNQSSRGLVTLSADPYGNQPLAVLYAGVAPAVIGGVFQINAKFPADYSGNGPVTLYLQASGIAAAPFQVYMAP